MLLFLNWNRKHAVCVQLAANGSARFGVACFCSRCNTRDHEPWGRFPLHSRTSFKGLFRRRSCQRPSSRYFSSTAPHLDSLPHLLLDDVDVVVVEAKISDAILDEPSPAGQDVRLVRLQHLLHQALGCLVPSLLKTLLEGEGWGLFIAPKQIRRVQKFRRQGFRNG